METSNKVIGEAIYRCEVENGIEDFDTNVRECRSYRRFDEGDPIERTLLVTLVNLARRAASAGNQQQLRFHVVSEAAERDAVFERLSFAAALKDWDGPVAGERPTGYVVILSSKPVAPIRSFDVGIAAQTIMLAATQAGYGGCMLRNFKPDLAKAIGLDDSKLEVELVLALGKPIEKVVLEPATTEHGLTYWRDADGTHHVPKLSLEDVLV